MSWWSKRKKILSWCQPLVAILVNSPLKINSELRSMRSSPYKQMMRIEFCVRCFKSLCHYRTCYILRYCDAFLKEQEEECTNSVISGWNGVNKTKTKQNKYNLICSDRSFCCRCRWHSGCIAMKYKTLSVAWNTTFKRFTTPYYASAIYCMPAKKEEKKDTHKLPICLGSHTCQSSIVSCHSASFSRLSIFLFLSLMSDAMFFMASSASCSAPCPGCSGRVYLSSSRSCNGYLQIFWTGVRRKPSKGISIICCRRRHACEGWRQSILLIKSSYYTTKKKHPPFV